MATLALNIAGLYSGAGGFTTAFGRGIAAFGISSLLGGKTETKGPRVKDRAPVTAQIHQPIMKGFGTYPVTGQVIWSTAIKEKEKTEEAGKGGGQEVTTYSYKGSIAYYLGQGPIERLERLRLNDKVLYDYNGGDEQFNEKWFGKPKDKKKKKKQGATEGNPVGKSSLEFDPVAGCFVSPNGKFRLYTGTQTQLPDALMEADCGIDLTPAYRGFVVLVCEDMKLDHFGGNYPECNASLVEGHTNVAGMANWICNEVGLNVANDVSMCEIANTHVGAFIMDEQRAARDYLDQISIVAQCDFVERDWKIRAMRRGRIPTLLIDEGDLCLPSGEDKTPVLTWKMQKEVAVPRILWVSALDASREYTMNSVSAWREVDSGGQGEETISLNMVVPPSQARRIAEIELARRYVERIGTSIALPPKHADLASADPIFLPTVAGPQAVILDDGQENLFGASTFKVTGYDHHIYDQFSPNGTDGQDTDFIDDVGNNSFIFADTNSMTDAQNERPIFYVGATRPPGKKFKKVTLTSPAFFNDPDEPPGTPLVVKLKSAATLGTAVGTLGTWHGGSSLYDDVNTLTVDLVRGTLYNVSDAELAKGKNAAILGSEGLQFGKAEYLGTVGDRRRYKLSHLVRGRRGTESFIDGHKTGEGFMLIDSAVVTVPYKPEYIRTGFEVKIIPDDEDDAQSVELYLEGHNMWPYSPHDVQGSRDGSNNLAITWKRRSRYSGTSPKLGEAFEKYEADILDGSGATVRTLNVTTPEALYTAAQQTADGMNPGDPVKVRIFQMSEVVGRGYPADATV